MAEGLGIEDSLSFSVESPFNYDEVMQVFAHDAAVDKKVDKTLSLLEDGEPTLYFKSEYALKTFKNKFRASGKVVLLSKANANYHQLFETFNRKSASALLFNLWEGLISLKMR